MSGVEGAAHDGCEVDRLGATQPPFPKVRKCLLATCEVAMHISMIQGSQGLMFEAETKLV